MKNKIKTILDKIEQKLEKHDTFILYIVTLLAISIFGIFVYLVYLAFTASLVLGILTIIVELGVVAWFSD